MRDAQSRVKYRVNVRDTLVGVFFMSLSAPNPEDDSLLQLSV